MICESSAGTRAPPSHPHPPPSTAPRPRAAAPHAEGQTRTLHAERRTDSLISRKYPRDWRICSGGPDSKRRSARARARSADGACNVDLHASAGLLQIRSVRSERGLLSAATVPAASPFAPYGAKTYRPQGSYKYTLARKGAQSPSICTRGRAHLVHTAAADRQQVPAGALRAPPRAHGQPSTPGLRFWPAEHTTKPGCRHPALPISMHACMHEHLPRLLECRGGCRAWAIQIPSDVQQPEVPRTTVRPTARPRRLSAADATEAEATAAATPRPRRSHWPHRPGTSPEASAGVPRGGRLCSAATARLQIQNHGSLELLNSTHVA